MLSVPNLSEKVKQSPCIGGALMGSDQHEAKIIRNHICSTSKDLGIGAIALVATYTRGAEPGRASFAQNTDVECTFMQDA
ncbi:hypothetical protein PIB30_080103 [Stylosanthes scabra]|uniref:Uncharacterized protein n=1 Tax=Stylosanthes scabra TaxID=79078 RepID=A0ABU6SRG4_9FABA|nr:hypothetical protein [Stylosanthes scabra]